MVNVTFFGVLVSTEKSIARGECDAEGIRLYNELVNYVESCPFTKSQTTKYICKNWRLKPRELTKSLNILGYDKANSTVRSQVSTASRLLYSIFGDISPQIFTDVNAMSDHDQALRDNLNLCLCSLEFDDVSANGLFIKEVNLLYDDTRYQETYELDDLKEELDLLKPLLRANIYRHLDNVNEDKWKYILSTINKPLSSVRSRSINTNKLEILRYLGLLDDEYIVLTRPSVSGVVKEVVEVQVPEKHRYKFGISKSMADCLDKKLSAKCTKEDVEQFERLRSSGKLQTVYQNLYKQLRFITEEGFADAINGLNVLVLTDLINGSYEGATGDFLK